MALRNSANVRPICSCTCIWVMPCSRYSIGSSTVTILRSTEFSASRPVYSVVVLPLPVGPVTSTMPFGSARAAWKRAITGGGSPSFA